ncbi:uncharacterized protein LOC127447069 [Myxocyprinus asiaticus]|uniref:uncharacterized protein LOC127447069 n=1 Tax=Myxocyprinus asiaticus TaxID=70543 RepID=UPI002222F075|nr:uncharacterized protein LOC127447069 [Myxocyprinus asiaticus]XP_051564538.1 uncharacterized protein LOC127447069 [Myxocyprinus asiaticus]
MEVFQARIHHLYLCVIITLLTYADCSRSIQVQKIKQHINKTVFVGETVTLQCNRTLGDEEMSWKMNNSLIFIHSPYLNRSMRNFTSDRMYIDPAVSRELKIYNIEMSDAGNYSCYPAAIRWILTITDQTRQDKQIPLNIIISCTGVIMMCLTIILSIWIHRTWKNKDSCHRETGLDFSQAPTRGRIQTQNSQYFERYNSVYGQV